VMTLASDWCANGFGELMYSVQTGKSGVEKYLGMPVFDWFGQNPEMASLFSETMVGFHGAEAVAVAGAYDFSKMKTIVDVGGATGNLLTAVLGRAPGARGILYDLPHVVRDAPAMIQSRGLTDRVTIEGGSFFELEARRKKEKGRFNEGKGCTAAFEPTNGKGSLQASCRGGAQRRPKHRNSPKSVFLNPTFPGAKIDASGT